MSMRQTSLASSVPSDEAGDFPTPGSSFERPGVPKRSNIHVVVRVRPMNEKEAQRKDARAVQCLEDGQTLALATAPASSPKSYTFNAVLDEKATQHEMFEGCGVRELIDASLDGYSCTAFAYGQTGSGKTHTITGPDSHVDDESAWGMIQSSMRYLLRQARGRNGTTYTFQASYIEIYNEQVKDLLNPVSARGALPVRWKADRGFYVENLFLVECETEDDMLAVLQEGLTNRQTGSHEMNERSSRSHSILTIYVNATERLADGDQEHSAASDEDGGPSALIQKHGQISFVDLAGSERVKDTKSQGKMLKESNNINKSLLTLGNCISALADPRKRAGHIPYRDSTLTMLLKDSLGGTGMTLMIACVSPATPSAGESNNTLRYASRAKRILNKPVVHMDPQQQLILALKREVRMLRTECAYLRGQVDGGRVLNTPSLQGTPAMRQAIASRLDTRAGHDPNADVVSSIATELTQAKILLQQYMQENEDMRMENVFLYSQQQQLKQQHEDVMRDNERLFRRLQQMEALSPITSSLSRPRDDRPKAFDKSDSTLHFEMINGTFASRISPFAEDPERLQGATTASSGYHSSSGSRRSAGSSSPSTGPRKPRRATRNPKPSKRSTAGSKPSSYAAKLKAKPGRQQKPQQQPSLGRESVGSSSQPLSSRSSASSLLSENEGRRSRPLHPATLHPPAVQRRSGGRSGGRGSHYPASPPPHRESPRASPAPSIPRHALSPTGSSTSSVLKEQLKQEVDDLDSEIRKYQRQLHNR